MGVEMGDLPVTFHGMFYIDEHIVLTGYSLYF